MSKKKTHEEYVAELAEKNPMVEAIEQYIDAKTSIFHLCKIHDVQWKTSPTNVLAGHGCFMCGNNVKKTHEQYVAEVAVVNPLIEVVGAYVNARTKIVHRCKIDGYIWYAAPYVVLRGDKCPKCMGNAKKTTKEYIDELSVVNPGIEVVGDYINATTPIAHRCKIDDHIWNVAPGNALNGNGCPLCKAQKLSKLFSKTHEQYVSEVAIINPDIEVLEQYVNSHVPILHRCKKDGYEWKIAPSNVLTGQGCPQCQESIGERKIRQWLQNNKIEYIYQNPFNDCKDKKELPFDFYLPAYNICIEFDGRQHFEPIDFAGKGEEWAKEQLEKTKRHDEIKNQYCATKNIRLLRIPYFKNIEEELNKFYSFNIVTSMVI